MKYALHEEGPKPCPQCGSDDIDMNGRYISWQECRRCKYEGPRCHGETCNHSGILARLAWNKAYRDKWHACTPWSTEACLTHHLALVA